jgi:hypothetical protein
MEGHELETHYRKILDELGKKPGMLGKVFKKARMEIQNPATLKRLIVDLIDAEQWTRMDADVGNAKGDTRKREGGHSYLLTDGIAGCRLR